MPEVNPRVKTSRFIRKPFYVDAVQVTEENIQLVAKWCGGDVRTSEKNDRYIKVRVYRPLNDRQTQAFVGDWILFAGTGYKVYTDQAFNKSFELSDGSLDSPGVNHRDASNGQFVSEEYAKAHPATTVSET